MNAKEIAEFMAERFKPNGISMDSPFEYTPMNPDSLDGCYVVAKTWRQHLIEHYMEDAEAFLFLLESKRLEIKTKPLE